MAWPPPVFRIDITNATAQQDEHPDIHNELNDSINADFRPRIDFNTAGVDGNAIAIGDNNGLIGDVASDLAAHELSSWSAFTAVISQTGAINESGPLTGNIWFQIRHGIATVNIRATIASGFAGGPGSDVGQVFINPTGLTDVISGFSKVVGHGVGLTSSDGTKPGYVTRELAQNMQLRHFDGAQNWSRLVDGDAFDYVLMYRTLGGDT